MVERWGSSHLSFFVYTSKDTLTPFQSTLQIP